MISAENSGFGRLKKTYINLTDAQFLTGPIQEIICPEGVLHLQQDFSHFSTSINEWTDGIMLNGTCTRETRFLTFTHRIRLRNYITLATYLVL